MSRATLLLDVDTTPARSALGDLRGSARSAQASLTAEARKGERERERVMRDESRAAQRAASEAARARARLERESTRAAQQAERERTRNAEKSAADRLRIERDETRKKDRETREAARNADRAEKERTRNAERESAKRVRAEEREARQRSAMASRNARAAGQRVIGAGVQAVGAAAVAMHGQFQDARERRAMGERVLGNAVRNANPNASSQEQAAALEAVRQFVHDTGMNFGDVANALMEGQAHGSTLQAEGGETTAQAIQRSLAMIREANAEGADPGQYLAARGRLAANGLSGDALKTAMRFSLAAAQAGQVEVDQIIGAGLPGASRLMNARVAALGPGASVEAQQQARLNAWRESVSTQEVIAASGGAAGHTSNTLASLQNFLNTPRRQEMALTNIKAAEAQVNTSTPEGRARAAQLRSLYEGDNALFERDPTRNGDAMRLRGGVSAAEFATRVTTATGGNAQMGANIFAGGGHGNAQAFLSNMRNLMAALGGEQGQRVQAMMQGMGVTDAQVSNHQRDVESDALSTLTRNQELRDNVLTDNTSGVKALSDSIRDWRARHPWLSGLAQEGGSTLGVSNDAALGVLIGSGVNERRLRSGTTTGGQQLGFGEGVLRTLGVAIPALGAVLGTNDLGSTAQRQPGAALNAPPAGQAAPTVAQVSLTPNDHAAIGSATAAALRAQPITAEVPLSADIHARAAGTRR